MYKRSNKPLLTDVLRTEILKYDSEKGQNLLRKIGNIQKIIDSLFRHIKLFTNSAGETTSDLIKTDDIETFTNSGDTTSSDYINIVAYLLSLQQIQDDYKPKGMVHKKALEMSANELLEQSYKLKRYGARFYFMSIVRKWKIDNQIDLMYNREIDEFHITDCLWSVERYGPDKCYCSSSILDPERYLKDYYNICDPCLKEDSKLLNVKRELVDFRKFDV